jgi:UDP-glucose 4-epimerase
MKRILLTGGTGIIGNHLIRKWQHKYAFVIFSRKNNDPFHHLSELQYELIQPENTVPSMISFLKEIDCVIHLAAKKPVSKLLQMDYNDFEENIRYSSNLFEACRQKGISNIVNFSSISVYGKNNKIPFSEDQIPLSDNFYGLAKYVVENIANYYNLKFGMKIKTLRIAHVLSLNPSKDFMIDIFVKRALNNEPINIWGKGKGTRVYVAINDVIEATAKAIEHKTSSGVFNVGMKAGTSHRQLAETINAVYKSKQHINFDLEKTEDRLQEAMSTSKIKTEWGWEPKTSVANAFKIIRDVSLEENSRI